MNATVVPDANRNTADLFVQHRSALLDAASAIVGRSQAEDVVQEAWLRAADALPAADNPVAYLFRVVRNLAIDVVRRSGREIGGTAGETVLHTTVDSAAGPEQRLAERDDLKAILRALDALPPAARRAFSMHRFDGRTYAEIARALGVSQGKAHKLVQTALAHCLLHLMEGGREDSAPPHVKPEERTTDAAGRRRP